MSNTLIQKPSLKPWMWLSLVVALAAGAYAWWSSAQAPREGERGQVKALAPSPQGLWPNAAVGAEGGSDPIPKGPVGDAKPEDFSQSDWDALNNALDKEPNKAQERQRLVSYLRFQRAVAQWSELSNGPDVAGRQALGRALLEQLPEHVAKGEVNTGEATLLLTALSNDLAPDPAQRQAWVDAQRARLQSTETPAQAQALAEDQRRNQAFADAQAQVVKAWEAQPVEQRDPADLERRLQALRVKVFGSGNP